MAVYENFSLRLRSSGPVPIAPGKFMQQTFGIDKNIIRTYVAETEIKTTSCDMMGAGGDLISANWQRLPYITQDCKNVFNGTEVTRPTFIDKDVI